MISSIFDLPWSAWLQLRPEDSHGQILETEYLGGVVVSEENAVHLADASLEAVLEESSAYHVVVPAAVSLCVMEKNNDLLSLKALFVALHCGNLVLAVLDPIGSVMAEREYGAGLDVESSVAWKPWIVAIQLGSHEQGARLRQSALTGCSMPTYPLIHVCFVAFIPGRVIRGLQEPLEFLCGLTGEHSLHDVTLKLSVPSIAVRSGH